MKEDEEEEEVVERRPDDNAPRCMCVVDEQQQLLPYLVHCSARDGLLLRSMPVIDDPTSPVLSGAAEGIE